MTSLTLSTFSELLRTRFRVGLYPAEAVELELVQVTPGGTVAKDRLNLPQYESFSLLFHGPQQRMLRQGTYAFEHPQIGRFDLFIVPIAAENGRVHYQAIFNRLVKAD